MAQQRGIDIRELIQAELGAYSANASDHINIDGSSLLLDHAQAIALGTVVNELAANAIANDPQSRLDIKWRADGNRLSFEWREAHKRKVRSIAVNEKADARPLRRLIEDQLGGTVHQFLDEKQTVCQIAFPLQAWGAPPIAAALPAPSLVRT